MKLLVATNNLHKIDEIRKIVSALRKDDLIEIIAPTELSTKKIEPEENGCTYRDNALIKAKAFFEEYGLPTIADDSGLEIDALDGAPGVISARFGGEDGNHKINREKVLQLLKSVEAEKKTARFRAVFCYIDSVKQFFVEGTVEGKLIDRELGEGGFGYDPLFIPIGYDQTFSEMSDVEKNSISHRYKATEALIKELLR